MISINWAGKPLRTFEFLLACIRGAKTDTGLQIKATLIEDVYEKGIQIAKTAMDTLCTPFAQGGITPSGLDYLAYDIVNVRSYTFTSPNAVTPPLRSGSALMLTG